MQTKADTALNALAEGYTAAWCSQRAASVACFYSPNGSLRINDATPAVGRDAIAAAAQEFMTAFPDLKVTFDGLSVAADRAVYYWTLTGTNSGPAGTGKRVHISGFEEWRIADDGLIAESHGHFDTTEYLLQIGQGATPNGR